MGLLHNFCTNLYVKNILKTALQSRRNFAILMACSGDKVGLESWKCPSGRKGDLVWLGLMMRFLVRSISR